jgi:DNA-binding LytR/AlgR family response regulator
LQNLKDFEKKLPSTSFIRVHKSYIIAAQHIDFISRSENTIGSYPIPVGEAFRSELNKFISENS